MLSSPGACGVVTVHPSLAHSAIITITNSSTINYKLATIIVIVIVIVVVV